MEARTYQDPREVEPLRYWVGDPGAMERLDDVGMRRGLVAFLKGDGQRSVLSGQVQVEVLERGMDPLAVSVLQADVAAVARLLGVGGAERPGRGSEAPSGHGGT